MVDKIMCSFCNIIDKPNDNKVKKKLLKLNKQTKNPKYLLYLSNYTFERNLFIQH